MENGDLFKCSQLRHFYDTEIKKGISAEGNEVIEVLAGANNRSPSKIVSKVYSGLQKRNGGNTLYIKFKWELQLNIKLLESDCHSMCYTQQTSIRSKRWREFGWKNLICCFITPH